MTTGERKDGVGGSEERGGSANVRKFVPQVACAFVAALLVLGLGLVFQIQILSLRKELEELKLNLTNCEEKTRNMKKRSPTEREREVREGIQAAHLQGTFPFQHIENQGRIGPWSASTTSDSFVTLRRENSEIEISQTGVYYVYAQVYYLTSEPHNSFQILSYNGTEERKHHRSLAACAAQGRSSMGEVSCHTGFAAAFRAGDRLYLNQIEQNRIVHFSNGCSYFGVVLLRKSSQLKRPPPR